MSSAKIDEISDFEVLAWLSKEWDRLLSRSQSDCVFLTWVRHSQRSAGIKSFGAVALGEGREKQKLDALARQLGLEGVVHFMGSVSNAIAYLPRMDECCVHIEGVFFNAILEYMACSLPVVATSAGGNTEFVEESNGICVPPWEPVPLADALAKLA